MIRAAARRVGVLGYCAVLLAVYIVYTILIVEVLT